MRRLGLGATWRCPSFATGETASRQHPALGGHLRGGRPWSDGRASCCPRMANSLACRRGECVRGGMRQCLSVCVFVCACVFVRPCPPASAWCVAAHGCLPHPPGACSWRADLSEGEARAILEDCMRVLWYRDTRALNRITLAKVGGWGSPRDPLAMNGRPLCAGLARASPRGGSDSRQALAVRQCKQGDEGVPSPYSRLDTADHACWLHRVGAVRHRRQVGLQGVCEAQHGVRLVVARGTRARGRGGARITRSIHLTANMSGDSLQCNSRSRRAGGSAAIAGTARRGLMPRVSCGSCSPPSSAPCPPSAGTASARTTST